MVYPREGIVIATGRLAIARRKSVSACAMIVAKVIRKAVCYEH